MKKVLKIIAGLCLLGVLLQAAAFLVGIAFLKPGEAGSIGIIGGADGPTVIYTTVQVWRGALWAALLALSAAAAGIIWIVKRHKGKHKK